MKKVKFTEDFEFNVHGGAGGRVSKQAGQLWEGPEWLCDKLVNHWEVASYHGVGPSETKAQKATYTMNHTGGGWYEIVDEDGDVVDKVRGKDDAEQKLNDLN